VPTEQPRNGIWYDCLVFAKLGVYLTIVFLSLPSQISIPGDGYAACFLLCMPVSVRCQLCPGDRVSPPAFRSYRCQIYKPSSRLCVVE
jgi:hypothetical protein